MKTYTQDTSESKQLPEFKGDGMVALDEYARVCTECNSETFTLHVSNATVYATCANCKKYRFLVYSYTALMPKGSILFKDEAINNVLQLSENSEGY